MQRAVKESGLLQVDLSALSDTNPQGKHQEQRHPERRGDYEVLRRSDDAYTETRSFIARIVSYLAAVNFPLATQRYSLTIECFLRDSIFLWGMSG